MAERVWEEKKTQAHLVSWSTLILDESTACASASASAAATVHIEQIAACLLSSGFLIRYSVRSTDYRLGTRLPGYVPDHGLLVAPGLNPKGPPQPQVSRRGYDLTTGHSHLTLLPSPKPQASSILPSITDFLLLTPRRLPSSAASTVLESMCYIDVVIYDQHNKWAN